MGERVLREGVFCDAKEKKTNNYFSWLGGAIKILKTVLNSW